MECLLREFQVRKVTLPVFDPERESNWTQPAKKRKLEADGDGGQVEGDNGDGQEQELDKDEEHAKKKDPESVFLTGLPLMQMPGHTGYLTFATLAEQQDCDFKQS